MAVVVMILVTTRMTTTIMTDSDSDEDGEGDCCDVGAGGLRVDMECIMMSDIEHCNKECCVRP